MSELEQEYMERILKMEGDIKAVLSSLTRAMAAFGITQSHFKGEKDFMAQLPGILGKLMIQVGSNTFDTGAVAEIKGIMPILEEYKYLLDEIYIEGTPIKTDHEEF